MTQLHGETIKNCDTKPQQCTEIRNKDMCPSLCVGK